MNKELEQQLNREIVKQIKLKHNRSVRVEARYPIQAASSTSGGPKHTEVYAVKLQPIDTGLITETKLPPLVITQKTTPFGDIQGLERILREDSAFRLLLQGLQPPDERCIPYYYGRLGSYTFKEFIFGRNLDSIQFYMQAQARLFEENGTSKQQTSELRNLQKNNYVYLTSALRFATLLHSSSQSPLLKDTSFNWLQLQPYQVLNNLKKHLDNIFGSSTKKLDTLLRLFEETGIQYSMCRGKETHRTLINGDFRPHNVLVSYVIEDEHEFRDSLRNEISYSGEILQSMRITDFDRSAIANPNIDIADLFENTEFTIYEHPELYNSLVEDLVNYRSEFEKRQRGKYDAEDVKADLADFAPVRLLRAASASQVNRITDLSISLRLMEHNPKYREFRKALKELLAGKFPTYFS